MRVTYAHILVNYRASSLPLEAVEENRVASETRVQQVACKEDASECSTGQGGENIAEGVTCWYQSLQAQTRVVNDGCRPAY